MIRNVLGGEALLRDFFSPWLKKREKKEKGKESASAARKLEAVITRGETSPGGTDSRWGGPSWGGLFPGLLSLFRN